MLKLIYQKINEILADGAYDTKQYMKLFVLNELFHSSHKKKEQLFGNEIIRVI
ncbi:hypothetical protein [Candidatus Enterovibrio altilux]|uniref:hypothetical protein n=1 Tax=Candidatus Enterovibrio altilux TaxID=1927128 RepID=UPI00374451C7